MATTIRAPFSAPKVTVVLPNPLFDDSRASESKVQVKHTMTGRAVTYVQQSDRFAITLPFRLTRMKALELQAFLAAYQGAEWRLTLYDGSQWRAQLAGGEGPVFTAEDRIGSSTLTGKEAVTVTLTISAKRL